MNGLTDALSGALIHSLWQDAIVALLLGVLLVALRHRTAQARYLAACFALALMTALPIVTTAVLLIPASTGTTAPATVTVAPPRAADGSSGVTAAPDTAPELSQGSWIAALQPWALPFWSVGVLLCSLRIVSGTAHALMLRRRSEPADEAMVATVVRISRKVGVDRSVRVLISTMTAGPATLGWLRPVVLLPPAAVLGISTQQLEALLAHELAHIRRHDYLVNVLQMVVETLLFYHPAIWWASHRIRAERELCCDDVAVVSCGDPVAYAHALARVAQVDMQTDLWRPGLAVGSGGGSLLRRIRRLLGVTERAHPWPVASAVAATLALAIALTVAGAHVQSQAVAPNGEFGIVRGQVLDARSGAAVSGAMIELRRLPGFPDESQYSQTTGQDGAYELNGVAPGEYLISARADGYGRTLFGQTTMDNVQSGSAAGSILEVPVRVSAGQVASAVNLPLDRRGILSGRVFGASGEPVSGIEVELIRRTYRPGGAVPTVVAFRQTERLGTFRMNVPPGEYYIRAYSSQGIRPSRGDESAAYAPTFFPGVATMAEAEAVTVAPGQELSEFNFIIATTETTTVSGRLLDPGGPPLSRAMVELIPQGLGSEGEPLYSTVDADGGFRLRRVIPGDYVLAVQDMTDGVRWIGVKQRLTVSSPINDLVVSAERAAHLEGRIVRDDGGAIRYNGSGMELRFDYTDASDFVAEGGHTEVGGTFSIHVPAGTGVLHVSRLAPGWIVRSVTLDGADIADRTVQLQSGARARLEIVISQRSATLTGFVTDTAARPVRYSPVLVFPADRARWSASRLILAEYSQSDGSFRITDVPPGDYRAVAVDALPPNAWKDPDVLDRLWAQASPVQLRERRQQSLPLKPVAAPTDLFD